MVLEAAIKFEVKSWGRIEVDLKKVRWGQGPLWWLENFLQKAAFFRRINTRAKVDWKRQKKECDGGKK